MVRRVMVRSAVGFAAMLACSALLFAQEPAQGARGGRGGARAAAPTLVLKLEWQAVPGEVGNRPGVPNQVPLKQGNIADPNVEMKPYGHASQVLTANGDPTSVWSGEAEGPFALTFRHKEHMVDLTGTARIRWVTKTSGFHLVRPVLKLADGTLLVGDFASANVPMLAMTEFPIASMKWVKLDPMRVVTLASPGNTNNEIWLQNPDLSKVDEVGFADLMPASGHGTGGYIHVGSIEVYGQPVPRGATSSNR